MEKESAGRLLNPKARYGITLVTAVLGGLIFQVFKLPLPWLLGPMLASLIGSNVAKGCYAWPSLPRNAGMIVVGYTIGLAMTAPALKEMSRGLPSMLFMTPMLILWCALIAAAVAKISGIDYRTMLLGSIPGGLTQMIVLAEETKGIDITIVTVTQVIRLMMIIITVPILVFGPLGGVSGGSSAADVTRAAAQAAWSGLYPNILLFIPVSIAAAILGAKIKFPTPYLLGPAIATAILQLCGLSGPALPQVLLAAAQLTIGTYVGLLLKPASLEHKVRTLALALGSSVLLIAGAWGLSTLLTSRAGASHATALLSLAPGGMDQMSLIAHEVNADLSMVAGYQVFRTFFIFLAVPPILRIFFKRVDRISAQRERKIRREAK
ncbi:AbrB family transcriptional regulator [Paenibacillus sp. HN-1]|uniref:AbrB family transcriptional regulator n=1 Tax=Paenibacillus TaxID=44249 RepID=UPI001CA8FD0F|nr:MULTISPECIES: AbrB family transcriptional regulator [Paenibacillus]MBY9079216.1 AbrB family transcriptional regulator [Paenibacillus sp. CGMCC 1.18879]MBY9086939.1 AbrB family transcriptional regulator [Paenibacillus sinensis]